MGSEYVPVIVKMHSTELNPSNSVLNSSLFYMDPKMLTKPIKFSAGDLSSLDFSFYIASLVPSMQGRAWE